MPHDTRPRRIRKEALPESPGEWRKLYATLDAGRAGQRVRPASRDLGQLYRLLAAGEKLDSVGELAKRLRPTKPYQVARLMWYLEDLGVFEERTSEAGERELVAIWPPKP